MKEHLNSIKLSRRASLKGMIAMAVASFLPASLLAYDKNNPLVHFVGIGGGGTNVVEYFYSKGIKAKYTCITDPSRSILHSGIQHIHFRSPGESIYKNGAEMCRFSDMSKAIEIPDSLYDIFKGNEMFILLSGLGGYKGTLMTVELTLMLHKQNKSIATISSLPFSFEGSERLQNANLAVDKLRHLACFNCINLEDIRCNMGTLTVADAYRKADQEFLRKYYLMV